MTLDIRSATPADVSAMHSLRKRVRENRLSITTKVREQTYLRYIYASSAWVAKVDTQLLGFAAIDAGAASIWALFVDPAAECQGIGRALHSRRIEWSKQRGIEKLSLGTQAGSRAVQFYRQAGWNQVGLTRDGEALFEKSL
jgi:GNAT superfamily N-acetyltransferase